VLGVHVLLALVCMNAATVQQCIRHSDVSERGMRMQHQIGSIECVTLRPHVSIPLKDQLFDLENNWAWALPSDTPSQRACPGVGGAPRFTHIRSQDSHKLFIKWSVCLSLLLCGLSHSSWLLEGALLERPCLL